MEVERTGLEQARNAATPPSGNVAGAFPESVLARRAGKPPDPDLIRILCDLLPRGCAVLDLGAGEGRHVRALRERGYHADGLDGAANAWEVSGGVVWSCDLAAPIRQWPRPRYDAALSIEVGEHIPEERLEAFLDNFARLPAGLLVISWAPPGQRGRGHVACRLPEWVAGQLATRGWALDHDGTARARMLAGRSGWARKIMVARR